MHIHRISLSQLSACHALRIFCVLSLSSRNMSSGKFLDKSVLQTVTQHKAIKLHIGRPRQLIFSQTYILIQ